MDVDWQAVGGVAGGIAALVGIPVAVLAWVNSRQAKKKAKAAEDQAEAAIKMATLAEKQHARETEPRLRIMREHGGFAQVQINESDQTMNVYVENLRPVVADLEEPYLTDQLGRVVIKRCEMEKPGVLEVPISPPGDDRSGLHELRFTVQVPEFERTGRFTATLLIQGGGWNALDETLELYP